MIVAPEFRKIIHIDMDCYFAAIEMRDNPAFRDKPLAVGGDPDQRGVIATANYHARRYGVRSAMASARARKLCPTLLIIPADIAKYRAESAKIRSVFEEYSSVIEPLSLDEAYLDVTDSDACFGSATLIASEIRRRIYDTTGLTASAGVSVNKFLAKVASEINKPNGQYVVEPDAINEFIRTLDIRNIPGVGKVTQKKLEAMGIKTCEQLQNVPQLHLIQAFGKFGGVLYERCRGLDLRPVKTNRVIKQLSIERTFATDLPDFSACRATLPELYKRYCARIERRKPALAIQSAFVKIKFSDFRQTTLERSVTTMPDVEIFELLLQQAYERYSQPVRLIGIGIRLEHSTVQRNLQLTLWDDV